MKNVLKSFNPKATPLSTFQKVALPTAQLSKIKGGADSIIIEEQVEG
ncbi:MAG: hypothetical protein ACI8P3_001237 [Saprospiraceae bacterium]|jgi:hypothetical protein